jgi:hypothetical protein
MANNTNINPIVVDTAAGADVLAASQPVKIQAIYWDGGASIATGDRCVVTDTAGNSIFESTVVTSLSSPGYVEMPFQPISVKGIKVPTLTHGKVFIYLVQ